MTETNIPVDETSDRPLGGRGFFRGHGLGNDYLVVDEGSVWRLTPDAVRGLCDRWHGVGSDGVVLVHRGETEPFRLRGFNPDGSEFERSGNGLRVVAAHLFRSGRVGADPFFVEIGGDRVQMQVHGADGRGEYDVSVDMGMARTGDEAVGFRRVASQAPEGLPERLAQGLPEGLIELPETGPLAVELVSVGNPHCVIFGALEPWPALERSELERLGSAVTAHEAFANGVNVQLARITAPDTLEVMVWERGVGATSASGTSACAVAVGAVASGRVPPGEKRICMEGGDLLVHVDAQLNVVLRGPVRAICDGELDTGFCRGLTGR
jgi:diaminopimelate epimerase